MLVNLFRQIPEVVQFSVIKNYETTFSAIFRGNDLILGGVEDDEGLLITFETG